MSWGDDFLGSLCERVSVGHVGKTSEFYTDETGIPFLRTQNVNTEGITLRELKYITAEFHEKLKKSTLAEGDVVLSRVISTHINCGLVDKELDGANCANIILARPKKEVLDAKYLLFYLRSKVAQRNLLRRQVGSAQSVVNTNVLKNWKIPLPYPEDPEKSLKEQQRIAAILDKADGIRRKRQQAIELADEFLRSVFLDMFGDPVTNPKGWEVKKFADLGVWSSGGTPSRAKTDYFEGKINWYSARELNSRYLSGSIEKISEAALKESAAKLFPAKSMLIGMYDTAAFKISILIKESASNQACANIIPNELIDIEWFYSYIEFSKETYLRQRRGVRQKNLNLGMIKDFELPLPPIETQIEFRVLTEKLLEAKGLQLESLSSSDENFNSLSQKAFKGEL